MAYRTILPNLTKEEPQVFKCAGYIFARIHGDSRNPVVWAATDTRSSEFKLVQFFRSHTGWYRFSFRGYLSNRRSNLASAKRLFCEYMKNVRGESRD